MTPQLAAGIPGSTGLTPERFVRTVLTEVRKTPKLLECTRESFLGAMMQVAQLGLEMGSSLGHCYLIPYWNGKQRVTECQLQIGYKGYIELAYRGGIIMEARDVYENDEFDFDYGSDPYIHHKWKLGKGRGELIGFYGTVRLPDGRTKFHVMDLDEIEARRQRAGSKDSGPWKTDFNAMARKTLIRAMVPQTPLSTEQSKLLGEATKSDDATVILDSSGNLRHVYQEAPDPVAIEAVSSVENYDKKAELVDAVNTLDPPAQKIACSRYLMDRFGKAMQELDDAELDQALAIAYGWPETKVDLPGTVIDAGVAQGIAEASSEPQGSAVEEILAGVPAKVATQAQTDLEANFGANYDPNSQAVLDWLETWLDQPADQGDFVEGAVTLDNVGTSSGNVSDKVLAETQTLVSHWDTATCDRVLSDYSLPKSGNLDSKRMRLVALLAPLREAGDRGALDLF